jgi:hypothetical protein
MATAPVPSEARVGALPTGTTWSIRSMRGALGALALLLALPITIAAQIVVPDSGQVVIHIVLCIGALLIALSVFDFATPHGLAWAACGAGLAIGAIFFTQALAPITQNETLMSLSYGREVSGWGETITITILMLWFMVLADDTRSRCDDVAWRPVGRAGDRLVVLGDACRTSRRNTGSVAPAAPAAVRVVPVRQHTAVSSVLTGTRPLRVVP